MSEPSTPPSPEDSLEAALQQIQALSLRLEQVEDQLLLLSDIDKYQTLQKYLKAGDFKAADLETAEIILTTVAKDLETLTPDDMSKFPCNVFQVIDRLWRTYSNGQFGLSVQLALYLEEGGSIDTLRAQNVEIMRRFCNRVSWFANGQSRASNYDHWDFSLDAVKGCFPAVWWKSPYGLKMASYCFMRLLACEIQGGVH